MGPEIERKCPIFEGGENLRGWEGWNTETLQRDRAGDSDRAVRGGRKVPAGVRVGMLELMGNLKLKRLMKILREGRC